MKTLFSLAVLVALSTGCAGRYYWHSHTHYGVAAYPTAPAQVVVSQPPPSLPSGTELQPPQPSVSSVWVSGHWAYNGMWTWVPGAWVEGYAGWIWTPPVILVVNGSYVLHRGYFREPAYQPPPVYSHPHRIHISVAARVAANANPPAPAAAAPTQEPEQPRELQVPGAVVRTLPAPLPPAAPSDPTPPATPEPPPQQSVERPVLVAPGATVNVRPRPEPIEPPQAGQPTAPTPPVEPGPTPVLSNVPPVVERPTRPPRKTPPRVAIPTPVPTTPEPAVEAPTEATGKNPGAAAVAPPVIVRPGGHAAIPSRRAPQAAPQPPAAAPAVTARPGADKPSRAEPAPDTRAVTPSRMNRARPARTEPTPQPNQARPARTQPAPKPSRARTTTEAPTPTAREGKPARETEVRPADTATRSAGRSRKEPDAGAPKPEKPATFTCTLVTLEAPRGGQLDVRGDSFGATPVVRIGGKVTRILRRNDTEIRVQIPRDSNGGPVTVQSSGETVVCGSLTIIGTNR